MKRLLLCVFSIFTVSADKEAVQDFIKATNLFTSSLYKEVSKNENGNFLVSPLSAEIALAFVESGCKDDTALEIRNAVHLPNDQDKISSGVKSFLPTLEGDTYALRSANKLYIMEKYRIHEEFKRIATEVFRAESENIDFTKHAEAAEKINKWVETHTNDKIHDLIHAKDINNNTKVVLVNALYLKADWETPFLISDTHKENFYKTADDAIEVNMMEHYYGSKNFFKYYECPHLNAKFLELPFKGGEASMTIILPNEKEGLVSLENEIERVFTPHNLTMQLVNVKLPKFKIETEIDLKKILENLGVVKAFSDNDADLSGIAGKKGDLKIDKSKQKTFIDVSENGVEAAAATYVLVADSYSAIVDPVKQFVADHPFIYYIKIKGAIAFAGRVTEPQQ